MYQAWRSSFNTVSSSVSRLWARRKRKALRNQVRTLLQPETLEYRAMLAGDTDQDLVGFAQALTTSGARLFGADWCPFCTEQKALFEEGAQFLDFVEITDPDREFNNVATQNNITSMPTWVFGNGQRLSREQLGRVPTLNDIASASGISIPDSANPSFAALGIDNKPLENNATIQVKAGSPLWIPLDGFDPTNQALTYTVTSTNTSVIQATLGDENDRYARISVDGFGDMVFRLFNGLASRPVTQFSTLADDGFYNTTSASDQHIFHRVVSDFVIQAGDPVNDNGTGGSALGDFDDQFNTDLQHNRAGLLSYAKSSDDTNDSQFFITDSETRPLDFNHSIFGVQVEGESARAGIQRTEVDGSDKPTTDVIINSITIFDDAENQAMLLKTPAGISSGTSQITVTARDPDGNEFSRTFTVQVIADFSQQSGQSIDNNGTPFFDDIAPITAQPGVTATRQLTFKDAENNTAVAYTATVAAGAPSGATASVSATGLLSVTAPAGFGGTFDVRVNLRQTSPAVRTTDSSGDTQLVSVNVAPAAPTGIDLNNDDDSGVSNIDNVTNSARMRYTVSGVVSGAEVSLMANGTVIATDTATSTTITFEVDPNDVGFVEGANAVTAVQLVGDLTSSESAPLAVTFDSAVDAITPALPTSAFANVPFIYNAENAEEGQQNFVYSLVTSPAGMSINPSTGQITWTPTQGQVGNQTVQIRATDGAGNQIETDDVVAVEAARYADITIVPVDSAGNTLTAIRRGANFFLEVRVKDLRPDATGVESAYIDIFYDAQLANVTGPIQRGTLTPYTLEPQGNTAIDGAITGAGGRTSETGLAGQSRILFRIPMLAERVGELEFSANPSSGQVSRVFLATSSGTQREMEDANFEIHAALIDVQASFVPGDASFNVNEDSTNTTFNVLTNDISPDDPISQLDIVAVGTGSQQGKITIAADKKTLLYSPAANFFGEETFTYTVRNEEGDEDSATVTVAVANVNDDPVAVNDTSTIAEDGNEIIIDVLDNDTDGPNETGTLTITAVGTTSLGGTATIDSSSGVIRYRPKANVFGTETFTYTVSDGTRTATGTVTVTINEVNDDPNLNPTSVNVNEDSAEAPIDLTAAFDSNPDKGATGETLTLTAASSPNGTVRVDANRLLYAPKANFQGTDRITYTVSDGRGRTFDNVVNVTVGNANDGPTAVDDTITVDLNSTGNVISVLANDTDPDTGDTLNVQNIATAPANGTATVSADGKTITYAPRGDFFGTDTFTYTVRDAAGLTDTATVTVTVRDEAPGTLTGLAFNDLNRDGRRDANEPGLGNITVTLAGKSTAGTDVSLTATTDSDGRYEFTGLKRGTYTVTQSQPEALNDGKATPGSSGGRVIDSNSIEVTIDSVGSSMQNVNFSERGSLPTLFRLFELFGSTYRTRNVLAAQVTEAGVEAPWTTVSGPGWDAYKTVKVTLSDDEKQLTIEATNSSGRDFRAEVDVTSTSSGFAAYLIDNEDGDRVVKLYGDPSSLGFQGIGNVAPSFTKGADQTVLEDAAKVTITNWATNLDTGDGTDSGQTLSFTVTVDKPELFAEAPAVDSSGTLTYRPAANANGSAVATVTLRDSGGTEDDGDDTSNPQTFNFSITPINDVPSFTKGPDQTLNETDTATQVSVPNWATKASSGPDNESSQTLEFVVTTSNDALFSDRPKITPEGKLTFTPAANRSGTATVTVTIRDNGGTANGGDDTSDAQTFTITVNGSNDNPIAGDDSITTAEEAAVDINVAANDSDPDGDTLSRTITTVPANGTASVNANGTIKYTPNSGFSGTDTFVYTASDGNGGTDTATVTVTVTPVNDPPSFATIANPAAIDEDSGLQTVNISGITAGAGETQSMLITATSSNTTVIPNPNVNYTSPNSTAALTYTPVPDGFGTATITVTLRDAGADGNFNTSDDQTFQQNFTVTVNAVNDVPSFSISDNSVQVAENAGTQFLANFITNISKGPANESGQQIEFLVENNLPSLFADNDQPVISPTGRLAFTPRANTTGTASVTVRIRDSINGVPGLTSASQTFTIVVGGVDNNPPTITAIADPGAISEDAAQQSVSLSGITAGTGENQALVVTATSNNQSLVKDSSISVVYSSPDSVGTLKYTPETNASGTVVISVRVRDAGPDGTAGNNDDAEITETFTITVNPVNDAPSFTKGDDQTLNEDSAPVSVSNWATNINAGHASENGQKLDFIVTVDQPDLFTTQPAIDANGKLTYELAPNASGTAVVSVQLHDDGGVVSGGDDTSDAQTFNIVIQPVNDPPTIDAIPDQPAVDENAGEQTLGLAGITAGGGETQTITVTAVSSNQSIIADADLVITYTSADESGSLAYTAGANKSGEVDITVTVRDAGLDGTVGNADDGITTEVFKVTINAVAGDPTLDVITDPAAIPEDSAQQTINLTGISDGDGNTQALAVTATSDNTALIADGDIVIVYTSPDATGSLKFTPLPNASGTATITVKVTDAGNDGTAGNADDGFVEQTFTVTVDPVNDAPTLAAIPDPADIDEDAGEQTINFTGVSAGAGETQQLSVTATSDNQSLIADGNILVDYVSPNATGSLAYTAEPDAFGTAVITVTVTDAGLDDTLGTGDDGVVTRTFSVTVNSVNDAPTIQSPGDQSTVVDDAIDFLAETSGFLIDDVDIGTSDVRVTLTVLNDDSSGNDGALMLGSTTGTTVSGSGTGSITITGTIDSVRDALNSLVFTPPAGLSGTFTLAYDIFDLSTVDELTDGGVLAIEVTT